MKREPIEAYEHLRSWWFEELEDDYCTTDSANEAIKIAFQEGQSNPKIKQLEWENVYSIHYVKDTNPIGYRAKISEWHISTTKYVLSFAHSGEINAKIYDTLEEAKAFAQDDFEVRIKKCLITK